MRKQRLQLQACFCRIKLGMTIFCLLSIVKISPKNDWHLGTNSMTQFLLLLVFWDHTWQCSVEAHLQCLVEGQHSLGYCAWLDSIGIKFCHCLYLSSLHHGSPAHLFLLHFYVLRFQNVLCCLHMWVSVSCFSLPRA